MSDQEMLDAIDAEIEETKASTQSCPEEFYLVCMSRIAGLSFARALIAKRMEGGK